MGCSARHCPHSFLWYCYDRSVSVSYGRIRAGKMDVMNKEFRQKAPSESVSGVEHKWAFRPHFKTVLHHCWQMSVSVSANEVQKWPSQPRQPKQQQLEGVFFPEERQNQLVFLFVSQTLTAPTTPFPWRISPWITSYRYGLPPAFRQTHYIQGHEQRKAPLNQPLAPSLVLLIAEPTNSVIHEA